MDYDLLDSLTEEELERYSEIPGDSEILKMNKRRLAEIRKEEKRLKQEKIAICTMMTNPEDGVKLIDLSKRAIRSTMQNEITQLNLTEEPYKDFSEEEQEFFSSKKHKTIYNLHSKVTEDQDVKEGIDMLKEKGTLDGRKQRHKKKINDYLGSIVNSKLIADMAARQKEQEERLARLELSQSQLQLAQKVNEDKFEQIGNALLSTDARLRALAVLGVKETQLEAYKLLLENPDMVVSDVASVVGKDRATVFRWLKKIKEIEDGAKVLQMRL